MEFDNKQELHQWLKDFNIAQFSEIKDLSLEEKGNEYILEYKNTRYELFKNTDGSILVTQQKSDIGKGTYRFDKPCDILKLLREVIGVIDLGNQLVAQYVYQNCKNKN